MFYFDTSNNMNCLYNISTCIYDFTPLESLLREKKKIIMKWLIIFVQDNETAANEKKTSTTGSKNCND